MDDRLVARSRTGDEERSARPLILSRRQLLRGGAALGGGALLTALIAACGGTATPTATTAARAAGTSPTTGAAPTTAATTAVTAASPTSAATAAGAATSPTSAAAGAASPTRAGSPSVLASPTKPTFTRQASIVEWGFGVEETNPMAFSRVNAFNQTYPNIKLEIVPKFDDQKLLTAAQSKQLPDLLWLGRSQLSSWAARGILRPIDEFIQKDKFDTSRFYDAAFSEVKYNNQIYGIPQFMTVGALYVNNDALKEAGTDVKQLDTGNWDQLQTLSQKLVKKSGDKVDRWGFDHKIQPQAGWLWLWGLANGGSFISPDLKKVTFNDPKIVEALDWGIKDYQGQGGYRAYSAVASTWQGDEQFARGLVAMTLYENWMLGIVARVAPTLNFTVLPMRQRNGSKMVSFTGGNAWAITSGAKDPEAAWEFIKFMSDENTWLLGAQANKDFLKKNNRPYVGTLTGDKIADQLIVERVYEPIQPKFDDAVKLFPQLLAQSQQIPVSSSPVSKQLTDILNNDGVKPAFEGQKSAKDALDQATTKGQQEVDSFKP